MITVLITEIIDYFIDILFEAGVALCTVVNSWSVYAHFTGDINSFING